MIDNKFLRENLNHVAEELLKKKYQLDVDKYLALEQTRRSLQEKTESFQAERNKTAKAIGIAKSKNEDSTELFAKAQEIATAMGNCEQELKQHQLKLQAFLLDIPNIAHSSTPTGSTEAENVVLKEWGTAKNFDFPVKDHVDLTAKSKQMDFDSASELTCSRFVVLRNDIALLNRALVQWMLDTHTTKFGYTEINTPVLANEKTLYGTGQLPKFKDDQFWTDNEPSLALIPTAEVTLTNLFRNQQIQSSSTIKLCAHSLCFRKEAGSYGKDTKGMLRMHQFEKVELVHIAHPDNSYQQLEELTSHAEYLLEALDLPYRRVALCTGDLGFSAAKTYDLEVWLPSQNTYREISSCSNTEAFQARRINIKIKADGQKPVLAHCLNGSGLAIGRTLLAIIENYQQQDGSINIPKPLQSYMHGKTSILND